METQEGTLAHREKMALFPLESRGFWQLKDEKDTKAE